LHKLTAAQLELIELIARGLTYDEIADHLGVSVRTAKTHTDKVKWILGVTKKRQIPQVARDLGLLRK
jgi:DNA-binding CsgD family transcriptional regulator